MVKPCRLEKYSGFLDFADDSDFIGYEIEGNKAILHLNACIMNEKYKSTLENLAQLCQERQIKSLILDLSRNMGGNSAVIDEFITYTNAESFRRYEMIDYSSGEPMQDNEQAGNRQEQKETHLLSAPYPLQGFMPHFQQRENLCSHFKGQRNRANHRDRNRRKTKFLRNAPKIRDACKQAAFQGVHKLLHETGCQQGRCPDAGDRRHPPKACLSGGRM